MSVNAGYNSDFRIARHFSGRVPIKVQFPFPRIRFSSDHRWCKNQSSARPLGYALVMEATLAGLLKKLTLHERGSRRPICRTQR